MKHIKQFEGFLDFFKKKTRQGNGVYYWTKDEIDNLSKLGLYNDNNTSPYIMITTHLDDIKDIKIKKFADADYENGQVDWFYDVTIIFNDGKEKIKDFDYFDSMIKYITPYVSEINISTKKYNL